MKQQLYQARDAKGKKLPIWATTQEEADELARRLDEAVRKGQDQHFAEQEK